jgi:hypothetical protein
MTVQFSVAVQNARCDAVEATVGPSAVVKIRSGNQPANCAAADQGTVLAQFNLAADWAAAAAAGAKAFSSLPLTTTGLAAGTAGHYRLYASDGVTCHSQGDIVDDMSIDNAAIAVGQEVRITAWSFADGNS